MNRAEVLYAGILLVDINIFGGKKKCPDVPVLVIKEPTELFMQNRKRRLPVSVGMNVPRSCFPPTSEVPSCLQAVIREVRLQQNSTAHGVDRTASRCHIPTNSIRVTGRQNPACHLYATPLAQPLPRGLLTVPALIGSDPSNRFITIANLSGEDVLLPARTSVALLQAIGSVDNNDIRFTVGLNDLVVSRETANRPADSAPARHISCPD